MGPFAQLVATAAAPARRRTYGSYDMVTSSQVLEFCTEPRTIHDVEEEFGEGRARFAVYNLVKRGQLLNLHGRAPRRPGLFVAADRAHLYPDAAAEPAEMTPALKKRLSAAVSLLKRHGYTVEGGAL